MTTVQGLIDRQLGIQSRLGYDSVLKRLVVREADSYHRMSVTGEVDPPIFACRFAEVSGLENILALANEDGRVAIQDISKTSSDHSLEGFECHNNAVFDLAWMPGHMNFVTVSGDHTACLWDVAEGPPKRLLVFSGHTRSVKTAVFQPTQPSVFATGGRDGNILVWDVRASSQPAVVVKPDNLLMSCHSSFAPKTPGSHGKRARLDAPRAISVTGLAFQDDLALISCGECDGNIKVWDLRKNYSVYTREPLPKHAIPYCGGSTLHGYTNLCVDEARVRLYASCMDNVIYCFNISTYSALPERRYAGHAAGTFYVKSALSPDGRYLAGGSSDAHAYVWAVRGGGRPALRLTAHRAEVTCAAWARNEPVLVTCSDDARLLVWRVAREDDDSVMLRGRAEAVPAAAEVPPPWGPPRPQTNKRRNGSNSMDSAKRPRTPTTKRCLAELLGATRESDEPASKRGRNTEPATLLPAGTKRPHTAETTPPSSPPKQRKILSPLSSNEPESPNSLVRRFAAGLPDFVATGEAPHLRLMSPVKRKLEGPDWLTLMSREKRSRVTEATGPKENVPARRNSTTEKPPRGSPRPASTLLRYFPVKDKV